MTVHGDSLMQAGERKWFLANLPPNARYLEIGSYAGASTACLLDERPDVTAVCVDPLVGDGGAGNGSLNDEHRLNFVRNCADHSDKMNGWIGTMETLGKIITWHTFDLVFVDGAHSEEACYVDLEWARQMVKENGGVVVVHDYHSLAESHQGVKRAVHSFMANFGWVSFHHVGLSIMLRRG